MIESYVREAIISILAGCSGRNHRPCLAMDFGANAGWMSSYMLALGAHVLSIEPQAELAAALNETVALNCWSDRSVVINGFACSERNRACLETRAPHKPWRAGKFARESVRMPAVPGYSLRQLLFAKVGTAFEDVFQAPDGNAARRGKQRRGKQRQQQHRQQQQRPPLPPPPPRARRHIDFLKLDGDGPELEWMNALDALLTESSSNESQQPILTVDAITVEHVPAVWHIKYHGRPALTPRLLQRFQTLHGYDVYRLDADDYRRLVTKEGWDAYSPEPRSYAPLAHVRGQLPRDALEEELLMVRAMRRIFRARHGLNHSQWKLWASSVNDSHIRYHVMELMLVHRRVRLLEPRAIGAAPAGLRPARLCSGPPAACAALLQPARSETQSNTPTFAQMTRGSPEARAVGFGDDGDTIRRV